MLSNFPTYTAQQLPAIFLNGISPESATLDYNQELIKTKKLREFLPENASEVFIAATQAKRPVFRFRAGQIVDVSNPHVFQFGQEKSKAICLGSAKYQTRGIMFIGYYFAYVGGE